MQGLQLKLLAVHSVQDDLKSLSAQLNDSAASEELDKIISRHNTTSAEVEANIQRLRDVLKLWDDVRAEMEACASALSDAQQLLTGDVPEHRDDLLREADQLQVVLLALNSDIIKVKSAIYHEEHRREARLSYLDFEPITGGAVAQPCVTANGSVNGNPSFSTPHRIDVP